ncbi:MAG: sensor histidine kinase, partial [Clostridium sp.]|nr:sensor histidine kinase [Clostridium sp.]
LEQELELIRAYMTIQKIRFEERLDYTIMVSPSYNKVPIPKLTIQPLVENAIQYGLEQTTEECVILITAELTGTLFSLYVKNNGSQFEDHLLERLQTAEILPNGLGIGLLNIDKRLKLTFGPEYGLSLYNEGELAVARISIPFQESEDHNAEADHCG